MAIAFPSCWRCLNNTAAGDARKCARSERLRPMPPRGDRDRSSSDAAMAVMSSPGYKRALYLGGPDRALPEHQRPWQYRRHVTTAPKVAVASPAMAPLVIGDVRWTPSGVRMRRLASRGGDLNWLFLPGGPGTGSQSLDELAFTVEVPGCSWMVDSPGDGSESTSWRARRPYRVWPDVPLRPLMRWHIRRLSAIPPAANTCYRFPR